MGQSFHLKEGICYFIGDSLLDVQAAKSAGCKSILVRSGAYGNGTDVNLPVRPDYVFADLKEAAGFIEKEHEENSYSLR